MTRKLALIAGLLALGWVALAQNVKPASPDDVKTVLNQTAQAMGALNLKTIEFSASGSSFAYGQAFLPYDSPPLLNVNSYRYVADYVTPGSRSERIRTQPTYPQRGGYSQPIKQEREIAYLSGEYAWGLKTGGNAPTSAIPPVLARQPGKSGLDSGVVDRRQIELWETPHGFLIAALKSPDATIKEQTIAGKRYRIVSFPHGKTRIDGYINDGNLVERVETWMPHPLLGDLSVESSYADYRNWGGVQFPTKWTQKWGGQVVLDLMVSEVKPNVSIDLNVPDAVRNTSLATAAIVHTRKESDEVYTIGGQGAATVAIGFRDFVVAIEAPTSQERSLAVMAEIKNLFPSKPIRYLVNTHAHLDNAAGIRPYAAEGITIITHKDNKKWLEEVALKGTWTIKPDKLSQMKTAPRVEAVDDSRVITDGSQQLFLYHVRDNPHSGAMLFGYLPSEKTVLQADLYSVDDWGLMIFDPFEPAVERPADYPCAAKLQEGCESKALYDNVQRLKLDVRRMIPINFGVSVSWDSFLRYEGRAREAVAKFPKGA